MKKFSNKVQRIKKDFADIHPAFMEHGVEPTAAQTVEAIQRSVALLTGHGTSPHIPGLWDDVKEMLASAYPQWNRRMAELDEKVSSEKRPYHKRNNILTHEELFFVDTFTKIQVALRRFAPADSNKW